MRRSTAAAVGTLTGAALIVGVRLSVSAPLVTAAPPAVDLAGSGASANPSPTKSGSKKEPTKKPTKKPTDKATSDAAGEAGGGSGLTDGTFRGKGATNPYGTVQVSIKIAGGKITAAEATYPTTGNSATINPGAVSQLKQETLKAQSADINAVSGATFTSKSYVESLQAALDAAGA
jgi:uncharacterized protein with FMN-binding domain